MKLVCILNKIIEYFYKRRPILKSIAKSLFFSFFIIIIFYLLILYCMCDIALGEEQSCDPVANDDTGNP